MRTFIMAAIVALSFASAANAAPCRDAKTGKFVKCPPPAAVAPHHPECKAGVSIACGASCIPKSHTCHKPA